MMIIFNYINDNYSQFIQYLWTILSISVLRVFGYCNGYLSDPKRIPDIFNSPDHGFNFHVLCSGWLYENHTGPPHWFREILRNEGKCHAKKYFVIIN